MRRWMGVVLGMVLVLGVAGCNWGDRIADLEAWAHLMTVDNDPMTTPGSPEDPAYVLVQSRAICKLLERLEAIDTLHVGDRDPELTELCGPVVPDPVYPPGFPPEDSDAVDP